MTAFLSVFDLPGILYAIGSGILTGATLVLWISLRIPPRVPLSTRHSAAIAAGAMVLLGTMFYFGQISQAILSGDPMWPRALARYFLWDVFAIAIGVGLGISRSFASENAE